MKGFKQPHSFIDMALSQLQFVEVSADSVLSGVQEDYNTFLSHKEDYMGCFDTVTTTCPLCGFVMEFQSKAGNCNLERYSTRQVPIEIAADLAGASKVCKNCGATVHLLFNLPKIVPMSTCTTAKDISGLDDK